MAKSNIKKRLILLNAEFLINDAGVWCFNNPTLSKICFNNRRSLFINKFFIKYSTFFNKNLKNRIKLPLQGVYFNTLSELQIGNFSKLICYYKRIFLHFTNVNFVDQPNRTFYSIATFFSNFIVLFSICNEIKN
jgi:hypothetical protein